MKATHELTVTERVQLTEANRLLTAITTPHHPCCECMLCQARMLTDVQDEASFTVQYMPHD